MSRWDKVCQLHRLLDRRRQPLDRNTLCSELDCSPATLTRRIATLRDEFGAPIENLPGAGWRYGADVRGRFELPGLWLSDDELHALALLDQLLGQIGPELLGRALAPVRERIAQMKALLPDDGHGLERLRLLPQGRREVRGTTLGTLARAVVERRRLHFEYHSRGKDEHTQREVSPQRLAYYRDNWYLDAWCHKRRSLRRFAVDRVRRVTLRDKAARIVSPDELQRHLNAAYGIFAGLARHTAILRFSAARARWVAEELWHTRQHGQWLLDGRYELHVPYGDPTELLMDLLRHAPEVEVVAPAALRAAYVERLQAGLGVHEITNAEQAGIQHPDEIAPP